ncbi:MAG TPA: hypothetical protein PLM89_08105 [Anaerolineales bacterium]|nr:hypothetical protein [Anaerolineales bacterium]
MRQRFTIFLIIMAVAMSACGGNEPAQTPTPRPSETPIVPPIIHLLTA